MSNTIDHENIAGEHDSKQIDSQHIDIEKEHKALIQSYSPAGWYSQPDGRQRYWDGQQWTENYTPAPVTTTSAEADGEPSVQRKRSSRVLVWILATVTVISLIITALVQVNINSTVTTKNAVIATANHARDVANANALAIETQLVAVGTQIQGAADTAAAKIAADKAAAAAAAAKQAALYKTFTHNLESQVIRLGMLETQGRTVPITSASCTVISVNAAGGGTYNCTLIGSNGPYQGTFTVPANGDWTGWVSPK